MIEKYNPMICICSHFHEHQGIKKIGKTFVLNSGYGHDGQMALVDLENNKIKVKLIK
jgi:Icc-related predicted phosphoesterase